MIRGTETSPSIDLSASPIVCGRFRWSPGARAAKIAAAVQARLLGFPGPTSVSICPPAASSGEDRWMSRKHGFLLLAGLVVGLVISGRIAILRRTVPAPGSERTARSFGESRRTDARCGGY